MKFKKYCSKMIITQLLLTVMCQAPRIRSILWLSGEFRVSHAWLAACGAGDMNKNIMEVLPIVEKTSLGNNCKDYFGMTGLVAALEKGRLVVVKRLLGVREIDKDFTQTDIIGRNALDMMIASPVDYFMTHNLRELASRLV